MPGNDFCSGYFISKNLDRAQSVSSVGHLLVVKDNLQKFNKSAIPFFLNSAMEVRFLLPQLHKLRTGNGETVLGSEECDLYPVNFGLFIVTGGFGHIESGTLGQKNPFQRFLFPSLASSSQTAVNFGLQKGSTGYFCPGFQQGK